MKNGRYTDIVLSPILFLVSYQGSFISGKISVCRTNREVTYKTINMVKKSSTSTQN